MKKVVVVAGVLLLLLVAGAWLLHRTPQVPKGPGDLAPDELPASGAASEPRFLASIPNKPRPRPEPFAREVVVLPLAEESLKLNNPDATPEEDLQILGAILEGFRRVDGSMPAGENAEIVSALRGGNRGGVAVLATNHPAIRSDGQLLDRWGTPYFFHSLSRDRVETRSAGPDRQFWTEDDVTSGTEQPPPDP